MMKPTNELRWKERNELVNEQAMGGDYYRTYARTTKVLQQKWIGEVFDPADHSKVFGKRTEEWRDVPTEKL